MTNCNIRNHETREPKPFFRTNTGLHSSYAEALRNTPEGKIEIGFIADAVNQEFVVAGEVFIETPDTIVGTMQELIKEGLLESEVDGVLNPQGTREETRLANLKLVEDRINARFGRKAFERINDTLVLNPNIGKVQVLKPDGSISNKTSEEVADIIENGTPEELRKEFMFPEVEVLDYYMEQIRENSNRQAITKIPTPDTNSILQQKLFSFLNSLGFQVSSIEDYKARYKSKNGVEPSAKALVDMANKIVAFANGEVTITELSEEVAHIIIEGWQNKEELNRLLDNVHHTKEWAQYNAEYREVYSKVAQGQELETMLRKEILGKVLRNAMIENFQPSEQRSLTEVGIWEMLLNGIRNIFNSIYNLLTSHHLSEINNFTERVNTLLHNERVDKILNTDNIYNNQHVMYAINSNSRFADLKNDLERLIEEYEIKVKKISELSSQDLRRMRTQVDQIVNQTNAIEGLQNLVKIYGIFDSRVSELISQYEGIQNNVDNDATAESQAVFEFLKNDIEPILNSITEHIRNNRSEFVGNIPQYTSMLNMIEETHAKFERLTALQKSKDSEIVANLVEKVLSRLGIPDNTKAATMIKNMASQRQRDIRSLYMYFGRITDSHNPIASLLGNLAQRMNSEVNKEKMKKENYEHILKMHKFAKEMSSLANGRYARSEVDFQKIENAREALRERVKKEIVDFYNSREATQIAEDVDVNDLPAQYADLYEYLLEKETVNEFSSQNQSYRKEYIDKVERSLQKDDGSPVTNEDRFFFASAIASLKYISTERGRLRGRYSGANLFNKLDRLKQQYAEERSVYDGIVESVTKEAERRAQGKESTKTGLTFDPNKKGARSVKLRDNSVVYMDESIATDSAKVAFFFNKFESESDYSSMATTATHQDKFMDDMVEHVDHEFRKEIIHNSILTFPPGLSDADKDTWSDLYNKLIQDIESNAIPIQDLRQYLMDGVRTPIMDNYLRTPNTQQMLEGVLFNKDSVNSKAFEFFKFNAYLGFNDSFFTFNDTLLEEARQINDPDINELIDAVEELNRRRSEILRKYYASADYKEVNADNMSTVDRTQYDTISKIIRRHRTDIANMAETHGVVIDNDANFSNTDEFEINNAFRREFEDYYSEKWTDASEALKSEFIQKHLDGEQLKSLAYFSNNFYKYHLNVGVDTLSESFLDFMEKFEEYYTNRGIQPPTTQAEIESLLDMALVQYATRMLPRYYKRFAPAGYNQLTLDMEEGNIGTVDVMDYIVNGHVSQALSNYFIVNPYAQSAMDESKLEPSFLYKIENTVTGTAQNKQSYEEALAQSNGDLYKRYQAYMHLVGNNLPIDVKDEYVDKTFIETFGIIGDGDNRRVTKNKELFEAYLSFLEIKRIGLEKQNMLLKSNVFLLPQYRRTFTERVITSSNGGKVKEGAKEYLKDTFTIVEDDEARVNQQDNIRAIPHDGLTYIGQNEVSTDLYASAWTFLEKSILYNERYKTLSQANALLSEIERMRFNKGVAGKNTNTYKMAEDFINYNWYGHYVSRPLSMEIMGVTIDVSKILEKLKQYISLNNTGMSPIIAGTSYTTAATNKFIQKLVNSELYAPADSAASGEWQKLIAEAGKEAGKRAAESKFEIIANMMGVYDVSNRVRNAQYSNIVRELGPFKVGHRLNQIANLPNSKVIMAKLFEYRVTDANKFETWQAFLIRKQAEDPSLSKKQIQGMFEKYKDEHIYQYIDVTQPNNFDTAAFASKYNMSQETALETLSSSFTDITNNAQSVISKIDGQIPQAEKTKIQRDSLLSFLTLHKSWMIVASDAFFGSKRMDWTQGVVREGYSTTLWQMAEGIVKDPRNAVKNTKELYAGLDQLQRDNLKHILGQFGMFTSLALIAMAAVGWADDDDESSWYKELLAYYALRTYNESLSQSAALPQQYLTTLESPVVGVQTLWNLRKAVDFTEIGDEVTRGTYKGYDRYLTNLIKLSWAKHAMGMRNGEAIRESRSGYIYYGNKEGKLFKPFSFLNLIEED